MKQAAEQIRQANSILLSCHVRPDADALGSLLGLALGLKELGKQAHPISPDGVPDLYRFLPSWQWVRTPAGCPKDASFDLGIGLDADGSDRLGPMEKLILSLPVVIDLDHHTGPDPFGDIQVVDPGAAATGELVYELLCELGAPLTPEIATCLLAALITDTGSFRFSSTTADSFRIAAALVDAGAHPTPIFERVYGSRPFATSRLLGRLLLSLERSADGRIVWAGLPYRAFQEAGLDTGVTEGFVDQIRMVEGSEVAIFFREERDGEIRVSLRSRGGFNVAKVADVFGGGGHVPAAGCSLPGPLEPAMERVVEEVRRQMHGDPQDG
jgi:phosphoesterase RecJ-like protein